MAAHFFYLDNKFVEFHTGCIEQSDFSQAERLEMLDEEVFLFYIRQLAAEVEYVLSLPFAHFWAEITKDT